MKVSGKVCIVTGGGNGIGAALVAELVSRGAAGVVVADRRLKDARHVAAQYDGAKGAKVVAMKCDCGVEEEVAKLCADTKAAFGRACDIFVANAGILGLGTEAAPQRMFDNSWNVNTMQIVWAARYALPDMLKVGGGGIIVTASAAGLLSQIGALPYTLTKHAAVAAAEWLSITYGDRGINVTCLCPQAVATNMLGNSKDGGVAGVDGILPAPTVAAHTIDAFESGTFLALPHKNVGKYIKAKGEDRQRWLAGMRRLQVRTAGGARAPSAGKKSKL